MMKVKTVLGSTQGMLERNTNLNIKKIIEEGEKIKDMKFDVSESNAWGSERHTTWAILIIYETKYQAPESKG